MSLIYSLFGILDYVVYSIAAVLVRVIIELSNENLFGAEQISNIVDKVYIVVGVLMLFKLVISAIQYMVNPDTFDDKEKGLAGILKKTAVSLALIVLMPAIFDFAMEMQAPIIKTLPKIILSDGNDIENKAKDTGEKVAFEVLSSFVNVKQENGRDKYTNRITDIATFHDHISDGCAFFDDGGRCQYDYMIILSTIGGGFLVYVLLSLTLDVAIRAIKFSIIRILAPIPISSYIYSKDKLNKFVKTAVQVYTDLFIRMAIIYFIIFAIELIFKSDLFKGTPDRDIFMSVVVKIALIFGLLMFAKQAPKFISELLGLPDVGSGEMADMFKPAWQRAGGAAGAIANPIRNTVANTRKAWANNSDMVNGRGFGADNKGQKIRKALQTVHRGINAGRHGIGGFAKGTLDSVQGVMNGDDWSKMNQRLSQSIKKSDMHSAAGYMKRTDKVATDERNEATKRRRKELENFYAAEGIDINNLKKSRRAVAERAYETRMRTIQNDMDRLGREISTGIDATTGKTLNADEISQRSAQFRSLQAERQTLSTSAGKKQFITNKTNELVAAELYSKEISAKTKKSADIAAEIAAARTKYSSATTNEEKASIQSQIVNLIKEKEEIDSILTDPDQLKQLESSISEYVKNGKLEEQKPDISSKTIAWGKFDSIFGGEGFTGKAYLDTADLLKNNRSALYTGEAMTKLRQNADILTDSNGNEATFTAKFTMPGRIIDISYAKMADLKRRFDNGELKIADLQAEGFENGAMLQSAFEDLEKQAAEAYVTANMAAADPTVASKFKLKRGPANITIVEGIKRLKAQIASSSIPKEEKQQLLKELSENPGKFFKGASDKQERMRTKGSRISAYNSGKKDG